MRDLPPDWFLSVNGTRLTTLSQKSDGEGFLTDKQRVVGWDNYDEALSWAFHESYERGIPVDICDSAGRVSMTVISHVEHPLRQPRYSR